MKKKATRKEVATLAGVSEATISNVLNDKPGFSCTAETRARVLDAAKKLGYTPSFAAGSLVKGKTNIIGLLIPTQERQFSSQFYARTIAGLTEASDETDYYLMYLGMDKPSKYRKCLDRNLLDGVFVFQTRPGEEHVRAVVKAGKPVVTINYISSSGCPSVTMDYESGIRRAFMSLVEKGCGRIGFVTFLMENQPVQRYQEAYSALCAETANIICKKQLIPLGPPEARRKAMATIPALGLDGIIVDEYWLYRELQNVEGGTWIPEAAVLCDERVDEAVPSNVRLFPTEPEEVGRGAWRVMQGLLNNEEPRENATLIAF